MKEAICRACGARMLFIKTKNGKTMPVDAEAVRFVPDPAGRNLYVLEDGSVVHGTAPEPDDKDVHTGYISHFATCTEPNFFRKPRKKTRKAAGA